MPKCSQDRARAFYSELLGLREMPRPEPLCARSGVWFDADGLDLHLFIEEHRSSADAYRHFGLECTQVTELRRN